MNGSTVFTLKLRPSKPRIDMLIGLVVLTFDKVFSFAETI